MRLFHPGPFWGKFTSLQLNPASLNLLKSVVFQATRFCVMLRFEAGASEQRALPVVGRPEAGDVLGPGCKGGGSLDEFGLGGGWLKTKRKRDKIKS